jgi:hypothetical protein
MLKRIWLALTLVMIAACSQSVNSIKTEQTQALAPNEGYLLLAVNTNTTLTSMSATGPKRLYFTKDDLKNGTNYILVAVPAGDYQFEDINFEGMYYARLTDDIWNFSVEAGKVNYVGHLKVNSLYIDNSAGHIFLSNNGSEAFKHMQEKFPRILKGHAMRYAGQGDDFFFSFIQPLTVGTKP